MSADTDTPEPSSYLSKHRALLELAPILYRLPRLHQASPSASLDKSCTAIRFFGILHDICMYLITTMRWSQLRFCLTSIQHLYTSPKFDKSSHPPTPISTFVYRLQHNRKEGHKHEYFILRRWILRRSFCHGARTVYPAGHRWVFLRELG